MDSACFDTEAYKYDLAKLSLQQQAALYAQFLSMFINSSAMPSGYPMMPRQLWEHPHAMQPLSLSTSPSSMTQQPMQQLPLQPLQVPSELNTAPMAPITVKDPMACDDDILRLFEDINQAAEHHELSSIASDSSNDTAVANNAMHMASDALTPHLSVGTSDATVGNAGTTPDVVDIMGPDMDMDMYFDQQLMGMIRTTSEPNTKTSPFDNSYPGPAWASAATTPTNQPTSPGMHSQAGSSMASAQTAFSLTQRSASLPIPKLKGGIKKPQAEPTVRRKPMPGPVLLGASGCDLLGPAAQQLRNQQAGRGSLAAVPSQQELMDDTVNDGLLANNTMWHNMWMDEVGPTPTLL